MLNENPAPVDEDDNNMAGDDDGSEDQGAGDDAGGEGDDAGDSDGGDADNDADNDDGGEGDDAGEESSPPAKRKRPAKQAKGKAAMKTKGKTAKANKGADKAKTAKGKAKVAKTPKSAKGGAKVAKPAKGKKANGNGGTRAGGPSKMSQAVAYMQAERDKLPDPKNPPRGFRKELIERTSAKFGLALATCGTQYGAKVHA